MDKFTIKYTPSCDNTYATGFICEFELSSDAHISEIHRLCKTIAAMLGYSEKSIEEYFGETCFDE